MIGVPHDLGGVFPNGVPHVSPQVLQPQGGVIRERGPGGFGVGVQIVAIAGLKRQVARLSIQEAATESKSGTANLTHMATTTLN